MKLTDDAVTDVFMDGGDLDRAPCSSSTRPGKTEALTRYAIDAATLLHLVSHDIRVNLSHQLVAPNSIRSQALQLLLDEVREGTLTERVAMQRHERLTELKMRLLGDRVSRRTAWRIASDLGLPISVAEVLAVARLQADALVTVDAGLAGTASELVPLATVGDLAWP